MATSPEGVAGVFDRVAGTYDDVGVPWFRPIAQALVDELDVRPGERVVDLGCGRGAVLSLLAAATGPTGDALGVDLAPRMVELTARDLAHLPHVRVRVADVRDPGLPPGSADVVAASLVLFFLPDPGAALRTWAGLLAPGGRLGVTTFSRQDPRWQELDELFTPYLPQQMLDARASGRRGPFGSDDGVEDLLRGAGLAGVRTVRFPVQAVMDDAEHVLRWTWSHGQRAMWEAVPPQEHEALRDRVRQLVARCADPDGRVRFDQDVRITLGRAA
ncbi:class I SAM-dependent methyltransferase [Aquipuribacter hungaricus]|uniref:Class I SAM-dependent methyltransferase n=1 Tax=Aquipuribacter hungaricus TaxID=545624 RepID=A0ABV7WCC6_9MICO